MLEGKSKFKGGGTGRFDKEGGFNKPGNGGGGGKFKRFSVGGGGRLEGKLVGPLE